MREDKYYDKAMKIMEEDKEKAILILEKGASKEELKSIMKLIDIKVDEYVSCAENEFKKVDFKFEYPELAKKTLTIYKIFPSYNDYYDNELLIQICECLEKAIKKDKSLVYDLGCLYTCLSLNLYEYTVIERISNGKLDDSIYSDDIHSLILYSRAKHKNIKFFKKALNLFKNNLDDYRNIEMYLGLLYCWKSSEEEAKKKRYQKLHDIIEKNNSYISKTNYLRMPMKIYFLNEDYDNAEKIANLIIERTNDAVCIDRNAAHSILYEILKIRGSSDDVLEEHLAKSKEFGYDEASKKENESGVLNTIHKLYRDKNDAFSSLYGGVRYIINESNKDDYKKLMQYSDIDIINIIKENNEPSYVDCLWKYYALKYVVTNNDNYYVMYIDEYIKCNTNKGEREFNSLIEVDFLATAFCANNEDLLKKAIEYSKYKKIFTINSGFPESKSYDELKKITNLFDYIFPFREVNALRAIYEYKNNNENNEIIKKFLIDGLCQNCYTPIYVKKKSDISSDDYNFKELNYFDEDFLIKLQKKFNEDGEKYGYKKISEIKDKLSILSLLAIDKYSLDEKEKFKDVIKKANNEDFLSNFKPFDKNFDLDDCVNDEYYFISEDSKAKITIISKGIKGIIFECLFNIFKSENNLEELRNVLLSNKDKVKTKEYIAIIDNKLNSSKKEIEKINNNIEDIKEEVKKTRTETKKIASSQKAIKKTQKEMLANQEEMKDMLENMPQKIAALKVPAEVDDEEELSKVSDEIRKIASETAEIIKQDYSNEKIESINRLLIELFGTEYHKLSADSKKMLVTAYITYDYLKEKPNVDFSGVCITVSKVVEREIKKRVYTNYTAYLRNNHHSTILELGTKTITKNSDFTLGSVAYLLGNITGDLKHHQPVGGIQPNEDFVNYIKDEEIMIYTNEGKIKRALKEIGEGCNTILEYRNDSAHTGAIQLEKAARCLNYILEVEKFLKETLAKFKE